MTSSDVVKILFHSVVVDAGLSTADDVYGLPIGLSLLCVGLSGSLSRALT